MSLLAGIATVAAVHMLALASPGPDFALITRQSLMYSKKSAVYTAIGIGLGIFVHVAYSIVGLGYIISQSLVAFTILKLAGAAYLIYLGASAFRTPTTSNTVDASVQTLPERAHLSPRKALWMGFATNALNAKASLYFVGLFTQVIHPGTPLAWQGIYGIEMALLTMAWFSLVATVLARDRFQRLVHKYRRRMDQAFGAVLVALGIKVALSARE